MDKRRPLRRSPWLVILLATFLLHVALGLLGEALLPYFPEREQDPMRISLVITQPEDEAEDDEEEPEEEEEEEPEPDGQIVETAKPLEEERPEEAEYLAEHDTTVEEETKVEEYRINPEVVAPVYSEEDKMHQEDLEDLNVDKPSTGATVGNDRFDPDRDGTLASRPSPWSVTNKLGPEDPIPSSHAEAALAGAPQNDLIDEEVGDQLQLNTKEVLYASYLLRIRRLVNFYWEQNLRNLPPSVRIAKPRYTTDVRVVLDGDGALQVIDVFEGSGVTELDDCVVRAYQTAGPFPNPPEQLTEKDGRVYLPPMTWTVTFSAAQNQFRGVDPNAGNQFPGILKSPR